MPTRPSNSSWRSPKSPRCLERSARRRDLPPSRHARPETLQARAFGELYAWPHTFHLVAISNSRDECSRKVVERRDQMRAIKGDGRKWVTSGWFTGPLRKSTCKLDPLPRMRRVMGTCCSRTVAYPCQIPATDEPEEGLSGSAKAVGRMLNDNARKLAKSFMATLHSVVLKVGSLSTLACSLRR